MHGNKWLIGTAASLSLAAAVFAVWDGDDDGKSTRVRVGAFTSASAGAGDETSVVHIDDSQSIELRIKNGGVIVARVNGKDVDQDRIRMEDGRIIILDEDGEPIQVGQFGMLKGGDGAFGRFTIKLSEDLDEFDDAMNTWRFGTTEAPATVMLGVHLADPGKALIKHLRLEPGNATLIESVYADLPAAEAGIEEFDIVIEIDGQAPADPDAIRAVLAGKEVGDAIMLTLISSGTQKEVTVELAEYDAARLPTMNVFFDADIQRLPFGKMHRGGMMFAPDGDEEVQELFITPQWRIEGDIDDSMRQFFELRQRVEADHEVRVDLGAQIDRLTERMAELEALLEKVIDEVR